MSDRNGKEFAITISKYCRGSLTLDEITMIKEFFVDKFVLSPKILIVNEHKNKLGQEYEHLHIFVILNEETRGDNLTSMVKKKFEFLHHKKDVITKKVYSEGWKEYISKTNDRKIVFKKGITTEEIEQWNEDYNVKVAEHKTISKVVKTRISKGDLPYVMQDYIISKDIEYDWSMEKFKTVIVQMINDNYDFEIKGRMRETKSKLDILFGNERTLEELLDEEFRFTSEQRLVR